MIDEGLTDEWPPDVAEAAVKFQQGDLISEPPLGYAASLKHAVWALTRQEAEENEAGDDAVHLNLDPADLPPYGIVVSQTCDVGETGRRCVQPWIEVCPVYERATDDQPPEYLIPLDGVEAPEGRMWVVDLRLTVPLEKGLLVGREPKDPFGGSDKKRVEFGVKLGERRARAALSDGVHVFITETLRKRRSNNKNASKAVRSAVYKLMLQVEGTRLKPTAVRLHVVYQPSDECNEQRLRDWFGAWWDKAEVAAKEHDVALLPLEFHDRTSMDVRLYDYLIPIDNPM